MLRKLLAPIAIVTAILAQVFIYNLNADEIAQQSENNRNYFIKPVLQSNVVVVEPNYGRFFNPDSSVEKDESGEILYSALEELEASYEIDGTQMISFDRKGQMVPNLYVRVKEQDNNLVISDRSMELLSDELIAE